MPSPRREITAAGAVVLRPGRQVLLVHRPKYDDWSFPKGKTDRGEHVTAAAVREVLEETGLRVRLGRPLTGQHYPTGKGPKSVHYWIARTVDRDEASLFVPNAEIDETQWVPVEKAAALLSYSRDRTTLAEALRHPKPTRTLVVLRHAEARSRRTWHQADRLRPLLQTGHRQAERLAPVLDAYGIRRVVTSSSTRCADTVAPYCRVTGLEPEVRDLLSEEGAKPRKVRALVEAARGALGDTGPTVICSHRPVLPMVFDALGLEGVELEKGELLVAHVRRDRVVAVERHRG